MVNHVSVGMLVAKGIVFIGLLGVAMGCTTVLPPFAAKVDCGGFDQPHCREIAQTALTAVPHGIPRALHAAVAPATATSCGLRRDPATCQWGSVVTLSPLDAEPILAVVVIGDMAGSPLRAEVVPLPEPPGLQSDELPSN
jgi:hypothetical protein